MRCLLVALASFAWTADAQFSITPGIQVQGGDLFLSVSGLPGNTICDVLFSPEIGNHLAWTLYHRGAAGQTDFLLPAPSTAAGYFRVRSDFFPVPTLNLLDLDGDGIDNDTEVAAGTDPYLLDSDSDGFADNVDPFPTDPAIGESLVFNPDDHTPPEIILQQPLNATLTN